MACMPPDMHATNFGMLYNTSQYIILNDGILRFNFVNITLKQGVYFTVHSLGSIWTNY